jgi:hypothetical protein
MRVGSVVEVRSAPEIMATLDSEGCVENVPFMPEMLKYCGGRFRVFKRVDKIVDVIGNVGDLRRLSRTVLLQDIRCDGQAHGGCQAGCQLLWKEDWLRRPSDDGSAAATAPNASPAPLRHPPSEEIGRIEAALLEGARRAPATPSEAETYRCQATELFNASSHLPRWDVWQYLYPLWCGNITLKEFLSFVSIKLFNTVQKLHGGHQYPHWTQRTLRETPTLTLNLVPGELVMVKTKEEIQETLSNNRNRGLWFDHEMLRFCGGRFRVLRSVDRLIDEKTGKLLKLRNPCVILDGVTAKGDFHRFYPQNDYPLWRDIWLRRVSGDLTPASAPGSDSL